MSRQGKIARLPYAIREQLNLQLLDGKSARQILPWLNGLPETAQLLETDFEGLAVNDQNLTDWRQGGYAEWERRRERLARTQELARTAVELAKASGGNLTEGGAAIAAGKILEVLESCDDTLSVETLKELVDPLVNLRSGDIERERMERKSNEMSERFKRTDAKFAQREKEFTATLERKDAEIALARNKAQRDSLERFLKWFEDERAKGILASPDNTKSKIDKLGNLIFGEDWE